MKRYWAIWFIVTFPIGFLVPEIVAIVRNRTQDTLSGAIWALEQLKPGQPITAWTAFHLLFTGVFLVLAVWLIFHFGWGIWR